MTKVTIDETNPQNLFECVYHTLIFRPMTTEGENRKRSKRIIVTYTQAPENVKKDINACFTVLCDLSFEQLIWEFEREAELGKSENRYAYTLIAIIQKHVGDLDRLLTPLGQNRRSDDLRTIFNNFSEESRILIDQIFEEICEYRLSDVIKDGKTPYKETIILTDYTK